MRVLALTTLLAVAAGHKCRDGSRVTCTKVQSSNGAPSTHGQSYGAKGYPTCSADGKRMFCLFDHDYHQCATGEEPCCLDGSNPTHRSSSFANGDGDDDHSLKCSSETVRDVATKDAKDADDTTKDAKDADDKIMKADDNADDKTMQADNAYAGRCGQEGLVKLRLNLMSHADASDVQLIMQSNKNVLEGTLAVHLGYKHVSILDFEVAGRRLGVHHTASWSIRFTARGKVGGAAAAAATTQMDLKQALQADLDKMNAGVSIEAVSVEWGKSVPNNSDTQDANIPFIAYIGIACGAFLSMSIVVVFVRRCYMTRSAKTQERVKAQVVEEAATKDVTEDLEKAKVEEDNASVSTDTPSSEPTGIDDGTNSGTSLHEPSGSDDGAVVQKDDEDGHEGEGHGAIVQAI